MSYIWRHESPYVAVCYRPGELRREQAYVIRSTTHPQTWHAVAGREPRCIATAGLRVCQRAVEAHLNNRSMNG